MSDGDRLFHRPIWRDRCIWLFVVVEGMVLLGTVIHPKGVVVHFSDIRYAVGALAVFVISAVVPVAIRPAIRRRKANLT